MSKIVDYIVIARGNPIDITSVVKEHIEFGWQPFGGIACNKFQYREGLAVDKSYAQAMVKYEKTETNELHTTELS